MDLVLLDNICGLPKYQHISLILITNIVGYVIVRLMIKRREPK